MSLARHAGSTNEHIKLYKVTLRLARSRQHPAGNPENGYRIVMPLDAAGRIDAEAWAGQRDICFVHRFRTDEDEQTGTLVHRPGGADGATWMLAYDAPDTEKEEAIFRLDLHAIKEGDYISIRDADEELNTYRVEAVAPF